VIRDIRSSDFNDNADFIKSPNTIRLGERVAEHVLPNYVRMAIARVLRDMAPKVLHLRARPLLSGPELLDNWYDDAQKDMARWMAEQCPHRVANEQTVYLDVDGVQYTINWSQKGAANARECERVFVPDSAGVLGHNVRPDMQDSRLMQELREWSAHMRDVDTQLSHVLGLTEFLSLKCNNLPQFKHVWADFHVLLDLLVIETNDSRVREWCQRWDRVGSPQRGAELWPGYRQEIERAQATVGLLAYTKSHEYEKRESSPVTYYMSRNVMPSEPTEHAWAEYRGELPESVCQIDWRMNSAY
jgi:hypothetical protein